MEARPLWRTLMNIKYLMVIKIHFALYFAAAAAKLPASHAPSITTTAAAVSPRPSLPKAPEWRWWLQGRAQRGWAPQGRRCRRRGAGGRLQPTLATGLAPDTQFFLFTFCNKREGTFLVVNIRSYAKKTETLCLLSISMPLILSQGNFESIFE